MRRHTLPVSRFLRPCPDCCAKFDTDRRVRHEDSCPLSSGIDRTCAADRQWFSEHPGETQRQRPLTAAERVELGHIGQGRDVVSVRVMRVPGGISRAFCGPSGRIVLVTLDLDCD